MSELTPQQALAEFDGGLSYNQMIEKHKLSRGAIEKLVKEGREAKRDSWDDQSKLSQVPIATSGYVAGPYIPKPNGESGLKVIRVPEAEIPQQLYKVTKYIPYNSVSGGGPFEIDDIICSDSFPHRKYSEWSLRNLLIEGKIVRI